MNFGFYVPELAQNGSVNDDGSNTTAQGAVQSSSTSSAAARQRPSLAEVTAAAQVATLSGISPSPIDPSGLAGFAQLHSYSDQSLVSTGAGGGSSMQPMTPIADTQHQHQQQQQQQQQQQTTTKASGSKPATGGKEGAAKPIGMACRACRLRKIRCGGERPRCSYCVKKGYECVLTPHKKRGRPRKNEQRPKPPQKQSAASLENETSTSVPIATAEDGQIGSGSMGMKAMAIPADPVPDAIMDGLDLDVRQLWAELTGLQGLDLPAELSALAANSATQAQDANSSSIPSVGPSFNLGIGVPGAESQVQLPQVSAGDPLLFASNYAFPRYEGDASSNDIMTPPPAVGTATQAMQQQQVHAQVDNLSDMSIASQKQEQQRQHLHQQQQQQSVSQQQQQQQVESPSSSAHLSFTGDGMLGLAKETLDGGGWQGHRTGSLGANQSPGSANNSNRKSSPNTRARSTSTQCSMPILQTIDEGIKMYFIYVHPWLPLLHRPTFERQVLDGDVDPILYYAVQAIASRFKERDSAKQGKQARRPYKRGQRYARAARSMLPEALKNARLSTLQAITILALYMSVSGHWQEGAAYEKLAVQLAFIGQYHLLDEEFLLPPVTNNMGLYETGWSEHSHPARLEVLSRPGGILEHEQRRRAWWSIFQLERFNGLAMGRPPIIKPGWHWVWLPCSEDLWARENPCGPLAWEMGLADFSQRPTSSVSNCRVDLILALIMGQMVEQRTEMFRLFFPRVDRGTLFYDNLPTHSLGWSARLKRLVEVVGSLERRVRQWHGELDRYADTFSARRHANFEIVGASCQIHLYACVLQIREHLFEDLLVNEEVKSAAMADESMQSTSGVNTPAAIPVHPTATGQSAPVNPAVSAGLQGTDQQDSMYYSENNSSRNSSVDLTAIFERHTGKPFERSTYQRGYMAKAKRPELTLQFVHDLDVLAQRCWDRSVAMSDEIARLLRVHWLRPFEQPNAHSAAGGSSLDSLVSANSNPAKTSVFDQTATPDVATTTTVGSARRLSSWTLGVGGQQQQQQQQQQASARQQQRRTSTASGSSAANLDPQIADRFKLMNPQTPYHLFVAGKVQAARLKQAVTARARRSKREDTHEAQAMDVDQGDKSKEASGDSPVVVEDAIRRINDIWDEHGLNADIKAIETRLDDIVSALEYCQLFWYSLNFSSHLKYLKSEASKPLLHSVYRE